MRVDKYKISIIIPVYNAEMYLERCIESIINQTYKNIEVILVDDGSTDSSGAICDTYADKDERVIVIHKENAGAGLARTTALEIASGDYYAFVDADDYLNIDAYEKNIDVVERENPDMILFGADFINFAGEVRKTNSNPFYPRKSIFVGEEVNDIILNMLELCDRTATKSEYPIDMALWRALFKADIIRKHDIKFLTERTYKSEDFIFFLQFVPKCNKVIFIEESLYNHCDNNDSISHNYSVSTQDKNDKMIEKMLDIIMDYNIYNKFVDGVVKVYLEASYIVIFDIFRNNPNISYKEAVKGMDYVCSGDVFRRYIVKQKDFRKDIRNGLFLKMMEYKLYRMIYIFSKIYLSIK